MIATVLYKQSLLDVALQLTGSLNSLVEVAHYNNISVTDYLVPGQKIVLPESVEIDKDILNYYKAKKVQPATAGTADELLLSGGIGTMEINKTFKVE